MSTTPTKLLPSWIATGVLGVLIVIATVGHLIRVKPPLPLETPPIGGIVDPHFAQQAARTFAETAADHPAADHPTALRRALQAAQADLIEVPLRIVAPHTTDARILTPEGVALTGVTVYPMAPNGVQPCVTPAAGIRGKILVVTSSLLAKTPSFSGCIAVVDAASPPRELGLAWDNYANLGFSAFIITHRDGLPAADWNSLYGSLVTAAPLPFPRAVATPNILLHDGEEVILHLRQTLVARQETGLVAKLPANDARKIPNEAIILIANLDEIRAVADLDAGPEQRIGAGWLAAAVGLLAADPQHRQRDVLVIAAPGVAEAQDGLAQLVAALGPLGAEGHDLLQRRLHTLTSEQAEEELLTKALSETANGWLSDVGQKREITDPACATLLGRELTYVMGQVVMEAQERAALASLAATRAPTDKNAREALINAKRQEARLGLLINFEPRALVERKIEVLRDFKVDQRLALRLNERQAEMRERIARHTAELRLGELMSGYSRVLAVSFAAPGDGQAGWAMASDALERRTTIEILIAALTTATADIPQPTPLVAPWSRNYEDVTRAAAGGCPLPTSPCSAVGWPAATLVSLESGRRMQRSSWPSMPFVSGSVSPSVSPVSKNDSQHVLACLLMVQQLAAGAQNLPAPTHTTLFKVSGTVLASGVGGSAVPTHPLAKALIGDKSRGFIYPLSLAAGYRVTAMLEADLQGRYVRVAVPNTLAGPYQTGWSPTAVTLSQDGLIQRHTDESTMVQNIARNLDLGTNLVQNGVDLVCFSATPIALLDRLDPRTMRTFAGIEFVRSNGLSAPNSFAKYDAQPGPNCWFVPPDERLAVLLKTGSEDNPLALNITAFLLGAEERGILPANGPFILEAQRKGASSLGHINGERLTGAVGAGLADQRTSTFNRTSSELIQQAEHASAPQRERILAAREAGTYGQIVYNELRNSISSAISSIVWYLFLLVPFAFFLERLAFGFADIRRAITAHAVIFLSAFTLLGLLHPAFRLVGSPIMILLGFVILLISLAVSGLFLARAKENLAVFDRRRGGVASAQPDLLGIISTSIALGINGLSRRKVRTGLTCATLSLITLCLILFLSARSGLIETAKTHGAAAYQGFIVRGSLGRAVPGEEILAIRLRYGQDHSVVERQTSIGTVDWERNIATNPECTLVSMGKQNVTAHGLLRWSPQDPLLKSLHCIAGGLPADPDIASPPTPLVTKTVAPRPFLVSTDFAEKLNISATELPAAITIAGTPCLITGLFEASSLTDLRDLDGKSLCPFDVMAMTKLQRVSGAVTGNDDDPLIDGRSVIITDDRPWDLAIPNLDLRTTTCAVILDNVTYRDARAMIDRRMEQTGQPLSYGLDGVAITGRSARSSALDSLADMLIPLLIAGLTVLNTMRGSVYERRDEISVYNAVGIAPRFISAMFFSEALVFAVVGSVIGYLLSLLIGRMLVYFGWEAGLQVDYASLTPIWASLALTAVVFISTWFPARAAAEIAAPSDDAGWKVPEPIGDDLSFPLPFAFGARDRIAVLAFFHRVFADHGDGGQGSFQCDGIRLLVRPDDRGPLGRISCNVWLKPFDLGVAQELALTLIPDAETGEWLAHLSLTRHSGTRESWLRLNRPFISALRQRFLHWRAVDAATRDELHSEAIGLLRGTHVHA